MNYLWIPFFCLQFFAVSGQQPDSLLLAQLNAHLKKPGDSLVIGYMNWENCNWGGSWLDFDENEQKTNALVKFLGVHPDLKIEIARHTDCRGRTEYNQQYSQKLAGQVKDILVKKGIAEARLVARGYGESRPVVHCPSCEKCTEDIHRKNSRFVVRLLE